MVFDRQDRRRQRQAGRPRSRARASCGVARARAAAAAPCLVVRPGADPPADRAAGHPHRRPHGGGRHLCGLLRLRRQGGQHARPLALRASSRRRAAWAEALAGFGWLRHLRAADTALARANARALVNDWIAQCGRPRTGPAWSPARRRAPDPRLAQPVADDPRGRRRRLLPAVHAQPRPPGRASCSARSRRRPRRRGAPLRGDRAGRGRPLRGRLRQARSVRRTRVLVEELGRQILADGGHVSRNPGLLVGSAARSSAAAPGLCGARRRGAAGAAQRDRPHDADAADLPARRRLAGPVQRHGRHPARRARDRAGL